MGLENLKSIFNENIDEIGETFQSNRPQDMGDTKFDLDSTIYQTHAFDISAPAPILDTLLRGWIYNHSSPPTKIDQKLFINNISDEIGTHPYQVETFDPRPAKNDGITINSPSTDWNTTGGSGTSFKATNPTDFSTAGVGNGVYTPLSQLGKDLGTSEGWQALYKSTHTPHNGLPELLSTPFKPYNYGGPINRDLLDIRYAREGGSIFSPSRTQLLGMGAGEPYIVSEIPTSSTDNFSGRFINAGSREIPIIRTTVDMLRLTKFLSSPAGLMFILRQNLSIMTQTSVIRDDEKLMAVPQRFNKFYSPLSTLSIVNPLNSRNVTGQFGNARLLIRRDRPRVSSLLEELNIPNPIQVDSTDATFTHYSEHAGGISGINLKGPGFSLNNTFTSGLKPVQDINITTKTKTYLENQVEKITVAGKKLISGVIGTEISKTSFGDRMTLADMISGPSLKTETNQTNSENEYEETFATKTGTKLAMDIESSAEGMPLYFKDLRDNTYIFFRAYLEGITENVAATWTPTNYVGRSSPAYVYGFAERDVTFTLKLFAHTEDELQMIYKKLNRLTSMCYPEYTDDVRLGSMRMKPPLAQLRLGEYFGNSSGNLLGFIQTLTYTVPVEALWETKRGKRVPKYIISTITYRIIHKKVPSLDTNFYGYTGDETGVAEGYGA